MKRLLMWISIPIIVIGMLVLYFFSMQNIRHADEYKNAKNLALSDGNFHVLAEDVFTNGPKQYVFLLGNDTGQQFWYFVYNGEIIKKVNDTNGIALEDLRNQLLSDEKLAYTDIFYAIPGTRMDDILPEDGQPYYYPLTDSDLFWEVVGRNARDRVQYAYFDFYTRVPIWTYELQ